MPSATITIHRIFMSSHLITQLIKKYVSKVNHLIIVIAKKVGTYVYYDNSNLNPSCDLLNMNCFWDFPDHFSSINLP